MSFKPYFFLLFLPSLFSPTSIFPQEKGGAYEERIEKLRIATLFRQGKHYFLVGEYREAVGIFQYLLQFQSSLPPDMQGELFYYLGACYQEEGLYDLSRNFLSKAVSYTHLLPESLFSDLQIRLLILTSQIEDPKFTTWVRKQKIRRRLSEESRDRIRYGILYSAFLSGNYPEVSRMSGGVPRSSQWYPQTIFLEGMSLFSSGNYQEAAKRFRKLVELGFEPGSGEEKEKEMARTLELLSLFEGENYQEFLHRLDLYYPGSNDKQHLYLKGWAYLLNGEYLLAKKTFEKFLELYPNEQESLEIAVLIGYGELEKGGYGSSYLFFSQLEEKLRFVMNALDMLRARIKTPAQFIQYFASGNPREEEKILKPITEWYLKHPYLKDLEEKESFLNSLIQEVYEIRWNLLRYRFSVLSIGSGYNHPLSFDYQTLSVYEQQLTEIRSHLLEMMLRPVRHLLVYQEYRYVNLAQDLRLSALRIIESSANPLIQKIIQKLNQIRDMRNYLRLLTETRYQKQNTYPTEEKVILPLGFLKTGDLLVEVERSLGELLFQTLLIRQSLWEIVQKGFDLEYRSAYQSLRRLGVWNTAYAVELRKMYENAVYLEKVLRESMEISLKIQEAQKKFVETKLKEDLQEWEKVSDLLKEVEKKWKEYKENLQNKAFQEVLQALENAHILAQEGKIDVLWIRRSIVQNMIGKMYTVQTRRRDFLESYYNQFFSSIPGFPYQTTVPAGGMDFQKVVDDLRTLEGKVSALQESIRFLSQGTGGELEKPETVSLPPTLREQ